MEDQHKEEKRRKEWIEGSGPPARYHAKGPWVREESDGPGSQKRGQLYEGEGCSRGRDRSASYQFWLGMSRDGHIGRNATEKESPGSALANMFRTDLLEAAARPTHGLGLESRWSPGRYWYE